MKDFETKLQAELDNLPFTQHLDDGQFNDGQIAGFEAGAEWAESINRSENPDSSKASVCRVKRCKSDKLHDFGDMIQCQKCGAVQ